MSYITNISTFAPKKLNYLSRSILHRMGIDENNNMVQSAVIREKVSSLDMTVRGLLANGINCKFVSYSKRMRSDFLCNIQQIKDKFDGVYFVMYYRNCAAVYYIQKTNIIHLIDILILSILIIQMRSKFLLLHIMYIN